MAKNVLNLISSETYGSRADLFVSQIDANGATHAIAVERGIKFFDGTSDTTGVTWNGRQELQVVIPTLADIVSNPVVFAGTVNASGNINWATGYSSAEKGYLVYIQENCTFAEQACEAGDMAVYDGGAWRVISGENQVSLAGTALSIGASGTDIITVEGQTLALSLNFDDIKKAVSYTTNASAKLTVDGGGFTIASKSIALSYKSGSTVNITTPVTISLPTELASDAVTIDSVLQASDFKLIGGSFPTVAKNSAATFAASHNLTVGASTDGDTFVTSVSAIKSAKLTTATESSNDIAFGVALDAISGSDFVTGVHSYDSTKDQGKQVAFTLWGQATVSNSTFVSGLGDAASAGENNLVSDVTVGKIALGKGEDILTGLGAGTDVITSVTFGSAVEDSSAEWFFSSLLNGSEVVSDVTVGDVTFVSGNDTVGQTASAVVSASVNNHVLSFSTSSFMKPVSISQAKSTVTKTGFNKTGVKLSGFDSSASGFTKAAIAQPTVTVSYKSVLKDNVALTQASTDWYFDTAKDHNYSLRMGYAQLVTEGADVTKRGAVISGNISTTISADTYVVGLNGDGSFPELSIGAPTGTISGQLSSKALVSSEVSWLAVDSTKKDIAVAGTYSLVEDSSIASAIKVAVAGAYTVDKDSASVTIPADMYVTDISVNGKSVKA